LLHVSSIVLQAIPLCGKDKASMLLPLEFPLTMTLSLKYALFASAAMFSQHPELYPDISEVTTKNRIDTAKKFASKAMRMVNNALTQLHFATVPDVFTKSEDELHPVPFEQLDLLDIIRTMLALSHFGYGIGEGIAIKLIRILCLI
jgi:hypothetical protein